jgi:hypothetical protein
MDTDKESTNFVHDDWLKLMFYFEHELTEGEITQETFNQMTNALMTFKQFWDI